MSNMTNNPGVSSDGNAPQQTANQQNKQAVTSGRPAPINTSIIRTVDLPAKHANITPSSIYSSSVKTGSSIQLTPALSAYSQSIWSPGVGTPMSLSAQLQSINLKPEAPWETPLTPKEASGTAPSTPSLGQDQHSPVVQSGSQPHFKTTHHLVRGEPGKLFGINYFDQNDVPSDNPFPLTRHTDGSYHDTDGQPHPLPKKASIFDLPASIQAASRIGVTTANGAAPPPTSIVVSSADDPEEIHYLLSEPRVIDGEMHYPFIETVSLSALSEVSMDLRRIRPDMFPKPPPFFHEEPHGGNWRKQLANRNVVFVEAFYGAIDVVVSLNPGVFMMPYGVSPLDPRMSGV